MKPLSKLDKIAALITGKPKDHEHIVTLLEIKPVSLLASLRIARMFGWQTNLKAAWFYATNNDGEPSDYMVVTEDKLIEVLTVLENSHDH